MGKKARAKLDRKKKKIEMFFNVEPDAFERHQRSYPDALESIARRYSELHETTSELVLVMNQHMKWLPLLDSWRIEICWIWDVCRRSMICAVATYEEYFHGRFSSDDVSTERIYFEATVEYYLENVIFRSFAIMEKIGHMVNVLMNLGLRDRTVSYSKVRDELRRRFSGHHLTSCLDSFESCSTLASVRETRNSLTHRKDPLSPTWRMEEMDLDISGTPLATSLGVQTVHATVPVSDAAVMTTEEFVATTRSFYSDLTTFVASTLEAVLIELKQRLQAERDHYNVLAVKNSMGGEPESNLR